MSEELTQAEFNKMLSDLAERNWKVKNILKCAGGYEHVHQRVKDLIDKELGITRTQVMTVG